MASFPIDGSLKGKNGIAKGTGLTVRGNKIVNSGSVALFVVEKVDFSNNRFEGHVYHRTNSAILVMGARDVNITRNDFSLTKGAKDAVHPIFVRDISNYGSGKVQINNNKLSTDGNDFVFVNSDFSGECMIGENSIIRTGKVDGTIDVVNKSRKKVLLPSLGKIINRE